MSESNNNDDLIHKFEAQGDQEEKNVSGAMNFFCLSNYTSLDLRAHCIKILKIQGCSGLVSLFVTDSFLDTI